MEEIKKEFNLEFADKYAIDNEERRRLWLNQDIDADVIDDYVYMIFMWNREDDGIAPESRKPIVIYINSPGGCVTSGYALIDAIQASKTPIITVNLGICYSMGLLIYLAGHKRYAMPHATFLMHDGSTGMFYESAAKVADRLEFEKQQTEERTKQFILSRSSLTEDQYAEKYRIEWYFYPEEGKSYDMVDAIIGEDCSIEAIL